MKQFSTCTKEDFVSQLRAVFSVDLVELHGKPFSCVVDLRPAFESCWRVLSDPHAPWLWRPSAVQFPVSHPAVSLTHLSCLHIAQASTHFPQLPRTPLPPKACFREAASFSTHISWPPSSSSLSVPDAVHPGSSFMSPCRLISLFPSPLSP